MLIAYLMGLSIGVHLLNLLAFPAMVFIYYFRKYPKVTTRGVLGAIGVSVAIVVFVLYGIVPGTVKLGAWTDLLFVNTFGLPINSGIAFYAVALFALLGWAVWYTYKKGKVLLNTILLMVTVVILGYSSYASVIIRAEANPPMNSNNPNNPYSLMALLNREQYGDRPLVKGQYYSSPAVSYKEKKSYYAGEDGKYHPIYTVSGLEYDPAFTFFFPRMHSSKEDHIEAYKEWAKIKGRQVPFRDEMITVPTFGENLRFLFAYQLNFMYWRYFLWNFVGRQSDVQTTGSITDGNWMSGVKAIDELYLGPQDNVPSETRENKGRNTYYFLPFILGIIGLLFQLNRNGKDFTVVMWLFFMTGIAIILYLNQSPAEPRERDYAYAGSFYAFSIWIGLGVLWIYELFKKLLKRGPAAAVAATVLCAGVPVILGAQNWDDHDRSHRYVARDFGWNYLESTLPNSIIINYGDNDTFPLWYNQEVEGVRTDVRVMNISYLGAEWYIDEMKIRANDSEPVPFSLPQDKYTGVNEMLYVNDIFKKPVLITQVIDWIKSDDPRTKVDMGRKGEKSSFLPARTIAIPVNKENALASGIVKPEDAELMVDTVYVQIKKSAIDRGEMMLLDLLANFDWKRPIYFTQPSTAAPLGLGDYLQFDGFAYRLVPIKTPYSSYISVGRIDTDYLYDKLMNTFRYGNVKDPRVNADFFVQHSFNATQARTAFARLAKQLAAEGEREKALEVLNRGIEEIPFSQIRHSYGSTIPIVEAYYAAGDTVRANEILNDYAKILKEYIDYYLTFPESKQNMILNEMREKVTILYELYNVAENNGQRKEADELIAYFKEKGLA